MTFHLILVFLTILINIFAFTNGLTTHSPGSIHNHPRDQFTKRNQYRLFSKIDDRIPSDIIKPSSSSNNKSLYKDIYSIAIPGLAACLSDPALTFIDTIYIGRYLNPSLIACGLAAMSVNGAIFNVIAALTYPLCTGTTAMVAKVRGKGQSDSTAEIRKALCNSIVLAVITGVLFTTILLSTGDILLSKVFGLNDMNLIAASDYLKIRALSMPSSMLNAVVLGFSLGIQDVIAPSISIVSVFILNILGDYLFIGRFGWGIGGAAWATAISSYAGSFLALARIYFKYKNTSSQGINCSNDINSTVGTKIYSSHPQQPNVIIELEFNNKRDTREKIIKTSKLSKLNNIIQGLREAVDVDYMKSFFLASTSLLSGSLINVLTYSSASRISSITTGSPSSSILNIASHQIVMQTWWFLSFFISPLSLVAQAILPRDIASNDYTRVKEMTWLLLKLATCVAGFCSIANAVILLGLSSSLTTNIDILDLAKSVAPQAIVSQFFICLSIVMNGIFIGSGNLSTYVEASVMSTVIAWALYAMSMWKKSGINGAWNGLLAFSLTRFWFYIFHLPSLFKKYNAMENKLTVLNASAAAAVDS